MRTNEYARKTLKGGNLLEPEYQEAYDSWKRYGTPEATGQLLQAVNPVVRTALDYYSGGLSKSPVARGRAKRLALDAFKSYDPQRASLRSHLLSNMRRLQRLSARERQLIRLPEQVAMDQRRLKTAETELYDRLSRPPSDVELSDHLGVSTARIARVRTASRAMPESLYSQPDSEGGFHDPSVQSLKTDDTDWLETVYMDLDPVNQFILERRAGLHGHQVQSATQIAKQLRISPAAVSQRVAKIQKALDMQGDLM